MRFLTRTSLVLLVVVLALGAGAPGAGAQSDEADEPDTIVVVTGRVEVREGETVDTVVIADGPVVVDGTVRDALVALNGDVVVSGTVEEDVVAIDGRVTVADGGVIEGDVFSRHRPVVQGDGRLDGTWERWDLRSWRGAASVIGWLAVWLAFTVSTLLLGLLLGLLAPRAVRAVDTAAHPIGPVILWGLVLLIGLPVVAVLATVTLVGLPLGIALLFALGLIYGIGYTAGAWVLGRRVASRAAPVVAFLAGWGILRLVALVPILGGLVGLAAVVVGLGAVVVAGHRARRGEIVVAEADRSTASVPPEPGPTHDEVPPSVR